MATDYNSDQIPQMHISSWTGGINHEQTAKTYKSFVN